MTKSAWIGYGRWRSTTQWTLRFFLTERSERASHVAKNEYPVNIMKHLSLITVALLVSFSTKGSETSYNYKVEGDYRVMQVWTAPVKQNMLGITEETLKAIITEQFARNEIRSFSTDAGLSRHYLAVEVAIDDDEGGLLSFGSVGFRLFKNVDLYLHGKKGLEYFPPYVVTAQQNFTFSGSDGPRLVSTIENELDQFILKYLEANRE